MVAVHVPQFRQRPLSSYLVLQSHSLQDAVHGLSKDAKDKSVRIATLSEAFKIRKPIYDLYDMFN